MNGPQVDNDHDDNTVYDVLILGGGVIGLACLRSATLFGWKCCLVEQQADLVSQASGSNSGIACTGVDAAPGTLERALIRDSISQLRPFLRQHNVPYRACGSIVCHWEWDAQEEEDTVQGSLLDEVLAESTDAGDTNASVLSPAQVQELEPNLATACRGAVHIPGEIVLDPWLYSISLACHARENGACIYTNFEFDPQASHWDDKTKTWTAKRKKRATEKEEDCVPSFITAKAIVNCTGIMADLVQRQVGRGELPKPAWTAQPRRGQYRVFSASPGIGITHPIQPIPTQFTKGIFIFSTLYNQVVVGPTALDQESRTDRRPDPSVADDLTRHVKRVLPTLDEGQAVGEYVGIRPGTKEHRDYQIHLIPSHRWIAAAGIRSTGLTASLGIGSFSTRLLQSVLPLPAPLEHVQTTPLPALSELVREYNENGDGLVTINGHVYRVTHPLTRFGWEARTGEAND